MQEFFELYPSFVGIIAKDLAPELVRDAEALRDTIRQANEAAERAQDADATRKAAREAEKAARKAEKAAREAEAVATQAEADVTELAVRIEKDEASLQQAFVAWFDALEDPEVIAEVKRRTKALRLRRA